MVFRVDASVVMGTGHVMRCLTLAEALRTRGAQCRFVTRALPGHQGDRIAAQGHAVTLLPAPDAQDAPQDAFGDDPGAAPAHAASAGLGLRRAAD
ncbi:MAG: UDP-2,4-diacetamido-2,4,6-trideoxy-beta-L-altropyranose hydrolase, partial [Rhodobacteraceae bacterium]|nr:UDP-2,4-diacetamido-2,4,6-trideoxy-beta-L-altropyranose hydrolase [Paracoccaceae bacterium]